MAPVYAPPCAPYMGHWSCEEGSGHSGADDGVSGSVVRITNVGVKAFRRRPATASKNPRRCTPSFAMHACGAKSKHTGQCLHDAAAASALGACRPCGCWHPVEHASDSEIDDGSDTLCRVCDKSAGPTGSAGVSSVPAAGGGQPSPQGRRVAARPALIPRRTRGRARRPRSQDFSQTLTPYGPGWTPGCGPCYSGRGSAMRPLPTSLNDAGSGSEVIVMLYSL